MDYSLTDLQNFIEACEHTTISEAAKKLRISQPALSASIMRLEDSLGAKVFYRSKRGIQLTPNGRSFRARANEVFEAFRKLHSSNNSETAFGGRTLTIGCHTVVAQYCLPNALSLLKKEAPDYKINLVHGLSRDILADIQLGRVDAGILINPVRLPDLIIRPLGSDTIGIWRSPASKSFDTIICEQDLFQTQSILKKWRQNPTRILRTSSIELMCHLTSADVGWGIIPERAVKLSGLDLVMEKKLPTFHDDICLVTRTEFGKSHAEKLVLESLRKSLAE